MVEPPWIGAMGWDSADLRNLGGTFHFSGAQEVHPFALKGDLPVLNSCAVVSPSNDPSISAELFGEVPPPRRSDVTHRTR